MTNLPESDRTTLANLGLDADAPGLVSVVAASDPSLPALAPQGVDPQTMKVTDIVFDARLLEEFDLEDTQQRNAASRKVFDLYKSRGRDKDRNSLLHREVGLFINRVRVGRKAGVPTEHVKDKVRKAKPQSDLLQALAAVGITSVDDLTNLLNNS